MAREVKTTTSAHKLRPHYLYLSLQPFPSSLNPLPHIQGSSVSRETRERFSGIRLTPGVPAELRKADRIESYTKRWDKDISKDSDANKQHRLDEYKDVVNGQPAVCSGLGFADLVTGYYDGATELYEYGWGTFAQPRSFGMGLTLGRRVVPLLPLLQGRGVQPGCASGQNECDMNDTDLQLARHEHYLAHQAGITAGMRVLDVGCGVGGPAREIARFTDANITGITLNDFQVSRARQKTARAGLSDKVNFVQGDFMKLSEQFGENSFDAGKHLKYARRRRAIDPP